MFQPKFGFENAIGNFKPQNGVRHINISIMEFYRIMNSLYLIILLSFLFSSCNQEPIPSLEEIRTTSGSICIRNVSVVDPVKETVLAGMDILIREGVIQSVSPSGKNLPENIDLEIPGEDFYAMPGFINTHTHLWQHLSRSVSPSEQLQQWIPKVYRPSFHMTDEEFFELNLAACYDALLHGITSVIDWSINADEKKFEQVLAAMVQSGLGGAVTFTHTAVFLPSETQLREFNRIREYAIQHNRDLFVAHLPPERIPIPTLYDGILLGKTTGVPIAEHILENVQCQRDWLTTVKNYLKEYGDSLQPEDKKFLEEIARTSEPPTIDAIAAMSQNARIILDLIGPLPEDRNRYNANDIAYLEALAKKTGPTYIPFLEHLGAFDNGYVSIHSAFLTPGDIEIYKKHEVYINHNPESNAYLASGIAPIASYIQGGVPVTIGTDGAASNDRIDMLAAMRLMSHLQKVVALNVPLPDGLDSWSILRSATIEGAKALQQENRIGSIEPGKEADIILLRTGSFELQPITDDPDCLANLIVNSTESRDIFAVLTDGKISVWNNRLVDHSEESLARRITQIRNNAASRSNPENKGREWKEEQTITDSSSIIRYRSIYPNYTADVTVTNDREYPVEVSMVLSDTEKAGGLFFSRETKARFPYKKLFASTQVKTCTLELPAGSTFSLKKDTGGNLIQFRASIDDQVQETLEVTLATDPEWQWSIRAMIYLEIK